VSDRYRGPDEADGLPPDDDLVDLSELRRERKTMKYPRIFGLTGLLVLLVGVFVLRESTYVVDEQNQAIVTQVGQYIRTDQQPGLYFKAPFYQSVTMFDRRIVVTDTPPAEYLTLDKKRIVVDPITRWRIADPYIFFVTVRDEPGARARLDDIVLSAMREEMASNNFVDIIDKQREGIEERVSKRAVERGKDFGLQVVDVRSKRADLPTEVQNSVFARMVAERGQVSKRYRSEGEEESSKIRAEADKERTILLARAYEQSQRLRGDGDAQATGVYAAAFGRDPEFYTFLRSLEAYDKFLGAGTTLVLSADSDLLRYLSAHRQQAPTGGAATAPAPGR
jgi:membrane protease subunit HflC